MQIRRPPVTEWTFSVFVIRDLLADALLEGTRAGHPGFTMQAAEPLTPERRLSSSLLWQLAAVCLIILGCKLWLISTYSSPLPFLDQWKGEGTQVLHPWMRGDLRVDQLFQPFNQHRIVLSRLLVASLFTLNTGQWDSQVCMVFDAILHASCAFILGALLIPRLVLAARLPILGALLVLFGLPFDWQNTLWGFQSQFYFLIFFTIVTIWGLAWHAAGSAKWWCGIVAGVLACLSLGSGGLAGFAVAGWLGVKFLLQAELRRRRGNWATLTAALAVGALGFALYTPAEAESLASFRAPTAAGFLSSFALHLGWPHTASPLLAVLSYAPMGTLLWLRNRRCGGDRSDDADDFLFPLGIWVALQAVALAWSRNHAMSSVISRYMDLLALGALVDFCCLFRIAALVRWSRRATVACGVAWSLIALAGLVPLIQRNFRLDLPSLRQIHRIQAAAVRQFLITDRIADLGGKPVFGLPPADLDLLAGLLRDPLIQNALPTGLGIRRVPAPPGPLSALSRLMIDGWGLVLGSGAMLLLLATIREWIGLRRAATPKSMDGGKARIAGAGTAVFRGS
jgi:hypothetical protein